MVVWIGILRMESRCIVDASLAFAQHCMNERSSADIGVAPVGRRLAAGDNLLAQ